MFAEKPAIAELVVRVLRSVSEEFHGVDHSVPLILNVTTSVTVDQLKDNIRTLIHVPSERMMLLFCGEVLVTSVPKDAFEPLVESTTFDPVQDEDNALFRPHVFLALLPRELSEEELGGDTQQYGAEVSEDGDSQDGGHHQRRHGQGSGDSADQEREGHHRHRRGDGTASSGSSTSGDGDADKHFDLRNELALISCGQHYGAIARAGFGSMGAFAGLTEDDLAAPGLWMPRRASVRILTLADTFRRQLQEQDADALKNHNHHVERDLLQAGKITTVAIEGTGGAAGQQFTKKADIRRAWAEEEHHRLLLLKQDQVVNQHASDPSRKQHGEGLQAKIDAIRARCAAQATDEGDEDFFSLRSLSRHPASPVKQVRAAKYQLEDIAGGDSGGDRHNRTADGAYCCAKHSNAVSSQKQEYLARRKMHHVIGLELRLAQVASTRSGFVRSSTLLDVARNTLSALHYAVTEEVLREMIDTHCVMSLHDQQQSIGRLNEHEVRREHLATLLPVKRYSAKQFVTVFSDMLESLDREHLL